MPRRPRIHLDGVLLHQGVTGQRRESKQRGRPRKPKEATAGTEEEHAELALRRRRGWTLETSSKYLSLPPPFPSDSKKGSFRSPSMGWLGRVRPEV